MFGKICTDLAFNLYYGLFYYLMQYLSIKVLTTILNVARMLTLLFLLAMFASCVLYFSKIKHKNQKDNNGKGLSKMNLAIIGSIFLIIILRSFEFVGTNIIRVIFTFQEIDKTKFLRNNTCWAIFRGIFAPILSFIELSLICYLIVYQDNKN